MRELGFYSPEDVIFANLQESEKRMELICEQARAHLRELAAEICESCQDFEQLLSSLPDHRPHATEPRQDKKELNATLLSAWQQYRTTWESVLLSAELKQRLLEQGELPAPEDFFLRDNTEATPTSDLIVYQRSSYADEAYLRFAAILPSARSAYAHSFGAVCEDVYNGLCAFGILPVESSSEGRLNSFTKLIERYDLRIAATCDVPATDGSRVTTFALLRRRLTPLLGQDKEPLHLEISVSQTTELSAAELLMAARLCGLRAEQVDTRPSADRTCLPDLHFSLLTDTGDLITFLLYLSMEAPQFNPIGLYPHIGLSKP